MKPRINTIGMKKRLIICAGRPADWVILSPVGWGSCIIGPEPVPIGGKHIYPVDVPVSGSKVSRQVFGGVQGVPSGHVWAKATEPVKNNK